MRTFPILNNRLSNLRRLGKLAAAVVLTLTFCTLHSQKDSNEKLGARNPESSSNNLQRLRDLYNTQAVGVVSGRSISGRRKTFAHTNILGNVGNDVLILSSDIRFVPITGEEYCITRSLLIIRRGNELLAYNPGNLGLNPIPIPRGVEILSFGGRPDGFYVIVRENKSGEKHLLWFSGENTRKPSHQVTLSPNADVVPGSYFGVDMAIWDKQTRHLIIMYEQQTSNIQLPAGLSPVEFDPLQGLVVVTDKGRLNVFDFNGEQREFNGYTPQYDLLKTGEIYACLSDKNDREVLICIKGQEENAVAVRFNEKPDHIAVLKLKNGSRYVLIFFKPGYVCIYPIEKLSQTDLNRMIEKKKEIDKIEEVAFYVSQLMQRYRELHGDEPVTFETYLERLRDLDARGLLHQVKFSTNAPTVDPEFAEINADIQGNRFIISPYDFRTSREH